MAKPQDWGTADTPYIGTSGVVHDRALLAKSISRDQLEREEHLGFAGWLYVCDQICTNRYGVGVFDLPDMTWRDWYDDRIEPLEAVKMAREEADTY